VSEIQIVVVIVGLADFDEEWRWNRMSRGKWRMQAVFSRVRPFLLRGDASLTGLLRIDKRSICPGWVHISLRAADLDGQLTQLGWHLFFIIPDIELDAVALDEKGAVQKATLRALREAEARKLNAVDIT